MVKVSKFLFIALLFVSGVAFSQTNGRFKSIASFNTDSTTVKSEIAGLQLMYDNVGALYYNKQSDKWKIFYDGAWHDLIGGGGGIAAVKAGNGLQVLSSDSVYISGGNIIVDRVTFLADTFQVTTTMPFEINYTGAQEFNTGSFHIKKTLSGTNNYYLGYGSNHGSVDAGAAAEHNINIGTGSGYSATLTGDYNIGIGYFTNQVLTSGSSNISMGHGAGASLTSGTNNIGLGYHTTYLITTGSNNVNISDGAGERFTGSSNANIMIGWDAGGLIGGAIANQNNNIAIGRTTGLQNLSHQLNIQNAIYGLSNSGSDTTVSDGFIGIHIKNPTARLEINSGSATKAPLKIRSGTLLSSPENYAIENDGTALYYTDNTTDRRALSVVAGVDGNIQYNNNGVSGGFASYDNSLNQLNFTGQYRTENIFGFTSYGGDNSQLFTVRWLNGSVGNSGTSTQCVNIFADSSGVELEDKTAIVDYYFNLTKADGSDSKLCKYIVGYRKDGTADPVQVGTEAEIFNVGNVTPTITFSIVTGEPCINVNDNGSGGWKVMVWANVSRSN